MSKPFTELDFGNHFAKDVAEGYHRFWDKNRLAYEHGRVVRTNVPRTRPSCEIDYKRKKKRKEF